MKREPKLKLAATVAVDPALAKTWRPSPEQSKQHAAQRRHNRKLVEAASAPLPGPLREAFAAGLPVILGHALQPVTAAHIACLTQIRSPFIDGIRYGILAANAKSAKEKAAFAKKAEAVENTIEDAVEVFFVFTLQPADAREAMLGSDPKAMIRRAAMKFYDALPPVPLDFLGGALAEHYLASFRTCIQHQAKEAEKDGKINFRTPARATDSAGSSIPSRD